MNLFLSQRQRVTVSELVWKAYRASGIPRTTVTSELGGRLRDCFLLRDADWGERERWLDLDSSDGVCRLGETSKAQAPDCWGRAGDSRPVSGLTLSRPCFDPVTMQGLQVARLATTLEWRKGGIFDLVVCPELPSSPSSALPRWSFVLI